MSHILEITILFALFNGIYSYYMPPNSMFRLGAFTCETSYISIELSFQSDTTNINFISYAANADTSCGDGSYFYSQLSVIGVSLFSGILQKNISQPLCYAFQNPNQYSTNLYYLMNIDCGTNYPIQVSYVNQIGGLSLTASIAFNCILGIIAVISIIINMRYYWTEKKKTENIKLTAIEPINVNL